MTADGRFLYASNRGHDSVVAFAVDQASGRLSPAGWAPSGGRTPRFIGLDPDDRFLYAANEGSDTVVRHRVDLVLPYRTRARAADVSCVELSRPSTCRWDGVVDAPRH